MAHSHLLHPVRRYLDTTGLTQLNLAERAGIHASRICEVLRGRRRRFSPEAARRIVLATHGAVTLEELLFYRPAPRRRKGGGR